MSTLRAALMLLLCAVPLAAQESPPIAYRLIRFSAPAGGNWWENSRAQDVPVSAMSCDLPPETSFPYSFTVGDLAHPGQVCLWVGGPSAEIFLSMLATRTHTFTVRQRFSEYEPWSDTVEVEYGRIPGTPTKPRIILP